MNRSSRANSRGRVALVQTSVLLLFIAAWELACQVKGVADAVAPPTVAVSKVGVILGNAQFVAGVGTTAIEVGVAVAVGAPLAVTVGMLSARLPRVSDRYFDRLTQLALATPQAILLPIFVFILGVGFTEAVVFGITHLLFVVILGARTSVLSVPPELTRTAGFFGAKRVNMARFVYLPAMLPTLAQALRLGVVYAIVGILTTQLYAGTDGIGPQINFWSSRDDINLLTGAVLIVTVGAVIINQVLFALERHFTAWQQ